MGVHFARTHHFNKFFTARTTWKSKCNRILCVWRLFFSNIYFEYTCACILHWIIIRGVNFLSMNICISLLKWSRTYSKNWNGNWNLNCSTVYAAQRYSSFHSLHVTFVNTKNTIWFCVERSLATFHQLASQQSHNHKYDGAQCLDGYHTLRVRYGTVRYRKCLLLKGIAIKKERVERGIDIANILPENARRIRKFDITNAESIKNERVDRD